MRDLGSGVGFRSGNGPGSSMGVRCDGPERNASTWLSCEAELADAVSVSLLFEDEGLLARG